jgi:hypothetical protein
MHTDQFADLLASFAQRPVPPLAGRHVYVWHGELAALKTSVPAGLAVELDFDALAAGLSRTPYAIDEARRVLHAAVQAWLRDHAPAPGQRQVVAVTGCSLLERYRLPLDAFFQASGDARMIVFVVTPAETTFSPRRPLPPYVVVQPAATLDFLRATVGEPAVVGGTPS